MTNCNNDDSPTAVENTSEWIRQADIPEADRRFSASVLTYDNRAFLMPGKGGGRFSSRPEILEFTANEWTQMATFDGFATAGSSTPIRNNEEIYIMGGVNISNAPTDEVRVYSITTNTFREETRFAAPARATYTETKAYFGDAESFSSFDFATNVMEPLPLIPGNTPITSAFLTTENNTIYALFPALETNNFFAFDINANEWISLPNFPGGTRSGALLVSTDTDVYFGLGNNTAPLTDIWRYNRATNEWLLFSEYPGTPFEGGFAFELNNQLFFGGGFTGGGIISTDVLNEEVYSIQVE